MERLFRLLPELSDQDRNEIERLFDAQYQKGREDLLLEQTNKSRKDGIVSALSDAGALDTELCLSVMDDESIIYEDGEFLGLSEEIDRIKSEYAYLFTQDAPHFSCGFNQEGDDMDLSALNYLQRLSLYRENPELYKLKMNK